MKFKWYTLCFCFLLLIGCNVKNTDIDSADLDKLIPKAIDSPDNEKNLESTRKTEKHPVSNELTDPRNEPNETESESCENLIRTGKEHLSHLFQPNDLSPGDSVAGLTVKSIQREVPGIIDEDAVYIEFCGDLLVSGSFVYYKNHEYFSNALVLTLDENSIETLPVMENSKPIHNAMLVFHGISDELKNKLGPPQVKGKANFHISDYQIQFAHTEIWSIAKLLNMDLIEQHVAAVLPDGTKLYENQEPVLWNDVHIEIINHEMGVLSDSTLEHDVALQLQLGSPIENLVIHHHEQIITNQEYTFIHAAYQQDTKYMLLLYEPHPDQPGIRMLYSIVITGDQITESNAKSLLQDLSATWTREMG